MIIPTSTRNFPFIYSIIDRWILQSGLKLKMKDKIFFFKAPYFRLSFMHHSNHPIEMKIIIENYINYEI